VRELSGQQAGAGSRVGRGAFNGRSCGARWADQSRCAIGARSRVTAQRGAVVPVIRTGETAPRILPEILSVGIVDEALAALVSSRTPGRFNAERSRGGLLPYV
jgi:hypothetical protein